MSYSAPVDDILLALKSAGNFDALTKSGIYDGLDEDTIRSILEEAGKFGAEVLEPLNWPGDREGCSYSNGAVKTPAGFREAYRQFADSGWSALPCPEAYGGQGLPEIVSVATCEIWNSANLAFGLCPLLTQGAIHAIEAGGSDDLKAKYLPAMVAGRWTGTMNLTEPHAGSDLSGLKSRAQRQADGTYLITGTKIFITCGEHDMAENIIHLVLARLPDAPAGTRGISLFLVPKYLVGENGACGARNDVTCAGIEHKLGIMGSPTCVMKFGEQGGATGYLVGEENRGLATMFVMMNAARLAVGMQGVAIAERATQRAAAFAKDRRQGRSPAAHANGMSPIIEHPDIRRSLLTMAALTQASRMICFATAAALDVAHKAKNQTSKAAAESRAALLTPIAKGFSTGMAVDVASIGLQIHGGMGFVEETGAAQHLRDSRILPIYEGTNGIQAIDLVTRKLPLDGGQAVSSLLQELGEIAGGAQKSNRPDLGRAADNLSEGLNALTAATLWLKDAPQEAALASATPYAHLFALVTGGALLIKGALATPVGDEPGRRPVTLARFFAENILTAAPGLAQTVMTSAEGLNSRNAEQMFA